MRSKNHLFTSTLPLKKQSSLWSRTQHKLFVGLDGGGTKIAITVMDENMKLVMQMKVKKSCNAIKIGIPLTVHNIVSVVRVAFKQSALNLTNIESILIGLAGVDIISDRIDLQNELRKALLPITHSKIAVKAMSDSDLALKSVANHNGGIIIIAGTGAVVYGINAKGNSAIADGFGYILGDKGSATFIGLEAFQKVAEAIDGRGKHTELTTAAFRHLKMLPETDIRSVVYSSNFKFEEISKFSQIVHKVALNGDEVANKILKNAGKQLAESANTVINKLDLTNESFPIGLFGSVFNAKTFVINPLMSKIMKNSPKAYLVKTIDQSEQAAILALNFFATNKRK